MEGRAARLQQLLLVNRFTTLVVIRLQELLQECCNIAIYNIGLYIVVTMQQDCSNNAKIILAIFATILATFLQPLINDQS